MANDTPAEKAAAAAAKAADDQKAAADKAAAANTPRDPGSAKGSSQSPEPDRDPVPTYRADMGEGLPPQKDQLNPDRAK